MNKKGQVSLLDAAEWLEFSPVIWAPTTGDERLAALVAYNTGDGSITSDHITPYTKKDGSKPKYPRLQSAFYGNIKADIEAILSDANQLGMGLTASVKLKKNAHPDRDDGYQLQLGKNDTLLLTDAGAPIGKKTSIEFSVPEWVMNADSGTKRAYLSALFGAEGSTPSRNNSGKSRFPRQPSLSMSKLEGNSSDVFFSQLRQMMSDLGVVSEVRVSKPLSKFGKIYTSWTLYVSPGADNILAFFENVGFLYCESKSLLGWQWSKYLRAYITESNRRRDTAIRLSADGETYDTIGRELGLTKGASFRLLQSIKDGAQTTAGQNFPHFSEWLGERWSKDLGLLRLSVINRSFRPDPTPVWNLLVSSDDHSYLLASGANNYNSFETMAGKVYYPFDKRVHVRECPFNPNLPIWVGQDFNIDPMSAVIMQPQPNGELWVIDEIVKFSSNTEESVDEIERRYYRYREAVTIFPDPAGGSRQHARGETDLDIFRERDFKRIMYRRKHPAVADRINCVNRMLRAADGNVRLYVDPKCDKVIESLNQTTYKKGTRDVDKSMNLEHCFHGDQEVMINGQMMQFKDIPETGLVRCHDGVDRTYINGGKIRENDPMLLVTLSNGVKIKCTEDHEFLTHDGWVKAINTKDKILCDQKSLAKLFKSMQVSDGIYARVDTFKEMVKGFIAKCMRTTSEKYQKGVTYTTLTKTKLTMTQKTSNASHRFFTCLSMQSTIHQLSQTKQEMRQLLGTKAKMVKSGTKNSMREPKTDFTLRIKHALVRIVERTTSLEELKKLIFALRHVNHPLERKVVSTTKQEFALAVGSHLRSIDTQKLKHVVDLAPTVLSLERLPPSDSYCLTVPEFGMFEVGGVIVSNCSDALGYPIELKFPLRKIEIAGLSI